VRIRSTPPAEVRIDGRASGQSTPFTAGGLKPNLAHTIELLTVGYQPFHTTVTPHPGQMVEVEATLQPEATPAPAPAGASPEPQPAPAPALAHDEAAMDQPAPRPAAPVAAAPRTDLEVEAVASSLSIPASRAARVRLNPARAYRLTVEGSASLGGLNQLYATHGCFYFVERDQPSREPAFGYLGPRDAVKISGARVLYGFVVDDTPGDNTGALTLVAREPSRGEAVKLRVDARANAVFPDAAHGARFTGLDGKSRLQLELRGAADLGGRQGRTDRVVFWYDGSANLTIAGKSPDDNHGVAHAGEAVPLEAPSQVVLFFPDDDPADNHGALSAALRLEGKERTAARPRHGR
jgi:hypothetical protein